jgi:hypothetical protein
MPKKKCKGCGRQFRDDRANVKFCSRDCSRITRMIQFHEYKIARLRTQQEQIRFYGGVLPSVKNVTRNSTGVVDPYHVPDEHC